MKPIEDLKIGDYVLVNALGSGNGMKVVKLVADAKYNGKLVSNTFLASDDMHAYNGNYNGFRSIRRKIIMKERT